MDDIDAVFYIDREIRKAEEAITYKNLTTERIFTIDRHVGRSAKPGSYVDLIKSDISELLDLSFVAETGGHVRGFVLGGIEYVGETASKVGVVRMIGVHPDYRRNGMATMLANTITDKFRSRGVKKSRIDIDLRDKQLLAFIEHLGFGVGHHINYTKEL